jgi:hypothetical protein
MSEIKGSFLGLGSLDLNFATSVSIMQGFALKPLHVKNFSLASLSNLKVKFKQKIVYMNFCIHDLEC